MANQTFAEFVAGIKAIPAFANYSESDLRALAKKTDGVEGIPDTPLSCVRTYTTKPKKGDGVTNLYAEIKGLKDASGKAAQGVFVKMEIAREVHALLGALLEGVENGTETIPEGWALVEKDNRLVAVQG